MLERLFCILIVATPTGGKSSREKLLLFLCQICQDHLTVRLGLQAALQVKQRIFFISFSDLVTLWVLDALILPLLVEKLGKIGEILVRS